MMCSSATALHAMRMTGNLAGKKIAIFGICSGASAVQLAQIFGVQAVYAIDVDESKLDLSRIITGRISFEKINEGMRKLETNEGSPIRIVVNME